MRFKTISVGKERADPAAPLVQDYIERIAKFFPIEDTVLRPVRDDRLAARIFKEIGDCPLIIGLDERGRTMDSIAFSELVASWLNQGVPRVTFVIGGAEGLLPAVKERCHMLLSLSKMTLPHRLARLLLAEQVYRALCIIRKTPYQK